MWKLKQMENWHLDNCWQLQQFNHGLKVGQDYIISLLLNDEMKIKCLCLFVVFQKKLGCIGEAEEEK